MAEDRVTIDPATLFDNPGDRQVEFSGTASGERYDFAVQYDVLEALGAQVPDGDAVALFQRHADTLAVAAGRALARFPDVDRVTVSETDLDQPWPAGRPHTGA